MDALGQTFAGFLMLSLVLLAAGGYVVLAVETAIFLFRRARRSRFFSGFATMGMTLTAGFILVGVIFGTNCQSAALSIGTFSFVVFAPPIRLVRIVNEECKRGTEQARLLYALSLALMTLYSFFGFVSILCSVMLGVGCLLVSLT